jgi:hypothetical protein
MFPVRYELGFYIPEDGILHSHAMKTSNVKFLFIHSLPQILGNHLNINISLKVDGAFQVSLTAKTIYFP